MLLTLYVSPYSSAPYSSVRIPAEVIAPRPGSRAKPYLVVDGKRVTPRQQEARGWVVAEASKKELALLDRGGYLIRPERYGRFHDPAPDIVGLFGPMPCWPDRE